jgi:hypothetical protein
MPSPDITTDSTPWVFDNSSPALDYYSLASTSLSGYNIGSGRKTFSFDFTSNSYFTENSGGHFAVVLRNNLAAISSGWIQGQGIIIGNVSSTPTPTTPSLPPGVPFAPNPAVPSTQIESFWNGVALDPFGAPYYANTLLANTNGANPVLVDGVTYRFSIVSEVRTTGSYTGYTILQGATVVYQQPLIYDYNTFYDPSKTDVIIGHVFENGGAAPWSVTISNKTVTWESISTYTFGSIPTSINEGSSSTFNLNTTEVPDGTTLYWTVSGTAADFVDASGSFIVNSNSGSFTVTPGADLLTEGSETFTVSIRVGSISGTVVATSSPVTINDTSISPWPLNTSTTIKSIHYNDIHNLVSEVIGVGENGYGISLYYSNPVTNQNISSAQQWRRLQADLNTAYRHITNQFAIPPGTIITGTTITSASLTNLYWNAANYVVNNRYTCHPNQYYVDPQTLVNINTTEGTSTRTLVGGWGLDPETAITHKVNVTWASRLTTRYFFNCGGKFEWKPYHTNTSTTGLSLNDLDEEWANFINYFQRAETYVYDRQTYEDWVTTSTVYNSGTLQISILADQETDRNIRFTFTFTNVDTADLVVIPSTEYYNIIV